VEKTDIDFLIAQALSGEATPAQLHKLEQWLDMSEENRNHFALLKDSWHTRISYPAILDSEESFEKLYARLGRPSAVTATRSRQFSWSIYLKVAASLLVVLSVMALLWHLEAPSRKPVQAIWIEKENPKGQKSKIFLEDGSFVWLNSSSKIRYVKGFTVGQRTVYLEGEAFFDVAHDPSRPFVVMADHTRVEALGTSFNVREHDEDGTVTVALTEGKVKVSDSENPEQEHVVIQPGQRVMHGKSLEVSSFHYASEIAWKDGVIHFHNAGLEEITARLSAWYGVEFIVQGKPDVAWKYSGQFADESLDNVLKAIGYAELFNHTIDGDTIYINF
jgi:ferric-dicitrate binding protein FerR (iron transport regulator)